MPPKKRNNTTAINRALKYSLSQQPSQEEQQPQQHQQQQEQPTEETAQVEEVAQVNVKVVSAEGAEVFFKLKRTSVMMKLMNAYCKKIGHARSQVRFLYDGKPLEDEKTPEDYEMDDDDIIDAMIEQVGGNNNNNNNNDDDDNDDEKDQERESGRRRPREDEMNDSDSDADNQEFFFEFFQLKKKI